MKSIKINNATEFGQFKAHLDVKYNKRILVTAPFGAGKSYFLNDFFTAHPEYIPVTLYPGDYSVSSNEDIFELIKYDILDALMVGYPERLKLETKDFSDLLVAQQFFAVKADLAPLLMSIAKSSVLGLDQLIEVFEQVKSLHGKSKEFRDEVNADEVRTLRDFMEPFEQKRGSVREYDGITRFISELLARIKSPAGQTGDGVAGQTILVVDDLDRLEADQIFRLFNIFSAHHDSREDANKFGFDKVILVCDLDNLEHMFRHRYGPKASFDGYIDKFYSYSPYFFNQQAFLKLKAREYLLYLEKGASVEQPEIPVLMDHHRFGKETEFFDTMLSFAEDMVEHSLLRARNFQKFRAYEFKDSEIHHDERNHNRSYFPLLVMASMLGQFFPRMTDLIHAVDQLAADYPSNYEVKNKSGHMTFLPRLVNYALPFLVENFTELSYGRFGDEDHAVPFINEHGEKLFIIFRVKDNFRSEQVELRYDKVVRDAQIINKSCTQPYLSSPNFYFIVAQALKICARKGYL